MIEKKMVALATDIVKELQNRGYQAFFAGGSVRDMVMGETLANDIDIATSATPKEISSIFKNVHGVGESFGVMLVVIDKIPFEVATFREDVGYQNGRHPESVLFSSPEKDAQRRDFTINGMFYDPIKDEITDFIGGKEDINKGVIRTIGSPVARFSEDYLRMLRAIRFASRFNFPIEEETWEALKKLSHNIVSISKERIFQEINKMLLSPNRVIAIKLLEESGLLKHTLPEITDLIGVEQPPEYHPEGDVFVHTLLVLENLEEPTTEVIAWSALLHDIGKPRTQTFSDRIRFNNHHKVGAIMTDRLLKRLKVPKDFSNSVIACVENHMHFISVQMMRKSKLKRFLARETIESELILHKADCLASWGGLDNYTFLKEKQKEFEKEGVKPNPLLMGKDLIDAGLKPSPKFGKILREAYDMQLEGEHTCREDSLVWLNDFIKNVSKEL